MIHAIITTIFAGCGLFAFFVGLFALIDIAKEAKKC